MQTTAKKNISDRKSSELSAQLARALNRPASVQTEPIIIEDQIAKTKNVHVVVIWDAWGGLTPAERSAVIMDACQTVSRFSDLAISVGMGLTAEEALRTGLLPYAIAALWRQGDRIGIDKLTKALEDVGGIIVKIGSSIQVRFTTLEFAEDAYRRLSAKIPGPYWAIVQDQSPQE